VKKFEIFENQLQYNLEMRKRAMTGWRKLKVLLVLLKLSGGKSDSHVREQHRLG